MRNLANVPSRSPSPVRPSATGAAAPVRRLSVTTEAGHVTVTWVLDAPDAIQASRLQTTVSPRDGLAVELALRLTHGTEVELVYKDAQPPRGLDVFVDAPQLALTRRQMGGASGVDGHCHYTARVEGLCEQRAAVTLTFSFEA